MRCQAKPETTKEDQDKNKDRDDLADYKKELAEGQLKIDKRSTG